MHKDWVEDAAKDLGTVADLTSAHNIAVFKDIIARHCPFKPDTAYIEVFPLPDEIQLPCFADPNDASCLAKLEDPDDASMVKLADTCLHCRATAVIRQLVQQIKDAQQRQPLLQCVDCHNTESPAGAMARYFNAGRCLHCGGYFKVVRA